MTGDVTQTHGTQGIDNNKSSSGATATGTQAAINKLKGEMNSSLNSSEGPVSADFVKAQVAQNQKYSAQLANIKTQISDLEKAQPPVPQSEITTLQNQEAQLSQTLATLDSNTNAVAFLYLSSLEAPAGTAPASNSPILTVPLPNIRQQLSVQDQVNLFLAPCLATVIFAIMEKVAHQKIENMDVYREFMQKFISYTEQFSLQAANAAKLKGELDADSARTQAIGQLVSAGLQLGLGLASMRMNYTKVRDINETYDARDKALLKETVTNPDGTVGPPKDLASRQAQLLAERQQAISNRINTDPSLKSIQLLESMAPGLTQGIAGIIAAGYQTQSASAQAAEMLFQQSVQNVQSVLQTLQGSFDAQTSDLGQFLSTINDVLASQTRQA